MIFHYTIHIITLRAIYQIYLILHHKVNLKAYNYFYSK